MLRSLAPLFVVALAACSNSGATGPAETMGAEAGLEAATDTSVEDSTGLDVSGATDVAVDAPRDAACPAAPAAPTGVLRPVAGELFYAQLPLGGFTIGESAILVGPDGTVVVVDVGNDSHGADVAKALGEITGKNKVDHIVITHFHSDHGDGIANLLAKVTLTGKIVHRGFTDFTKAANDKTIQGLCNALAARPGVGVGLCNAAAAAPCSPSSWSGSYPVVACPGLATADLPLGSSSMLDFVAANGFIGTARYDTTVSPFLADDSNGENARSVLAIVRHGAFRMLLAGDLTGGGSVTDDVESFYATRLAAAGGVDALGVDVLHASHHGRNTSSNVKWVGTILPSDGRARNAVMGVSTAHVGSPHAEVLTNLLSSGRLGAGRAWTTRVAATGATAAGLVDAGGGRILVSTLEGGAAYVVQALRSDGSIVETRTFRSVHACP